MLPVFGFVTWPVLVLAAPLLQIHPVAGSRKFLVCLSALSVDVLARYTL